MSRAGVGLALAGLLATAALAVHASGAAAQATTSHVVLYHDAVQPLAKTAELERAHGFRAEHRYVAAVKGFAARLSPTQRARVAADPDVASLHEDREVRLIAPVSLRRTKSGPSGVRRIGGGTKAAAVAVAVLDTGIDLHHPALNVESGATCIAGQRRTTPAQDDNGHGTHVAGTIGAKDAAGVVGVAPGTKLYAVKVLNASGSGTTAQAICGIDWVTANAAKLHLKVASLSFGTPGTSDGDCGRANGDPLHRAICRSVEAGVTYVVAAGNDGADLGAFVPAAYPEVLTVTAMSDSDGAPGGRGAAPTCKADERDDAFARFSNYASDAAEAAHVIAAPGVCITSTWPGGRYATISGTSMSTQHVSGAVALCIGSGACSGAPAQVIATVRADAARHATARNGFAGDPNDPVPRRWFGYLVWAGGY